ncbi:MAG: hypothetical protein ACOVP1_01145 [Bacteroidia bacterium]
MKKLIVSILFLLVFGLGSSKAQLGNVLDRVQKNTQAELANAQKQLSANALTKMDTELMKKFGLDAAKTSVVGNTIKVLVADQDFSKLSAAAKSKTAAAIGNSTKTMVNGMGTDLLKAMGLSNWSNIVVEMVSKVGNTAKLKDTFTFNK